MILQRLIGWLLRFVPANKYTGKMLDNFAPQWQCPTCDDTVKQSYLGLLDSGNPICGECDSDMILTTANSEIEPN